MNKGHRAFTHVITKLILSDEKDKILMHMCENRKLKLSPDAYPYQNRGAAKKIVLLL